MAKLTKTENRQPMGKIKPTDKMVYLMVQNQPCQNSIIVVLLHCGCLSLNPFIEFRVRNNSSSSDVLYSQASISVSPKYESK